MAFTSYASSLRGDRGPLERSVSNEQGVPFFVPQLSKVKTNVTCQSTNQHLLFCFEKPSTTSTTTTVSDTSTSSPSSSYRKQGNKDLYSVENLRKRQLLLGDPQVLAAIARFWETFPHIRQGHATSLEKRDYVDVFIKFFKALVAPSEFSMAEAKQIVERDWQRDAGTSSSTSSTSTMTLPLFNKALFEVADIWTVGIGPEIYVSFLHKLYDRVTMRVYDQDKCVWLTVFADLDKIRPFGAVELNGSSASACSSVEETKTTTTTATTNQDLENGEAISSSFVSSPVGSTSGSGGGGATTTTKTVSKPPLLKKKMLSVPNSLGSPTSTKSNNALLGMLSTAENMGGSMRRLPDLQTPPTAAPGSSSLSLGIASRGAAPPSPPPPSSQSQNGWVEPSTLSSRSDGAAPLESPESAPPAPRKAPNTSITGTSSPTGGNDHSRASTTSMKMIQRSASLRREQLNPTNKKRDNTIKTEASSSPTSDDGSVQEGIPPQQVRLSMPSIYLSPEITPSNAAEKAARRRIRESMKLAQRLRRITF